MASKFVTPKRKEEYVHAVHVRTNLAMEELRKHDVERLKLIWSMVKPKKPQSPLPVGWKKFDVAALKEIYEKEVCPDLGRTLDRRWARWNRPQLVTEIEMWVTEVMGDMPPEDVYSETPMCPQCQIPLVVRTNRLTKEDFYGCVRYPRCTQTLPLTYGGRPTKEVQDQLNTEREVKGGREEGHQRGDPENGAEENFGGVTSAARKLRRAASHLVRWVVGTDGACSDRGEHRRGEGETPVQHQPHARGDEADPRHAEGQGERGEVTSTSEACATVGTASQSELKQDSESESCKSCKPQSMPRSPKQIRECILEGVERRRAAKRGTIKRLLGNAKAVAASVMLASCAAVGMAMQTVPQGSIVRPDLLEIFGGEAQVTQKFSRWGWNAARPVSLGSDDAVCDADGQSRLLEWIERCQPRLVVVTYPRRIWMSCVSTGESSSQQARRARKRSLKHQGFVRFVEQVFEKQIRRGDDALAESPVGDDLFRETAVRKLVDHPQVYTTVVSSSGGSDKGLPRSSLWMSTSVEVCEEIALRCTALTKESDRGPSKVAAAICKGYVKTLRRKEPSRIRRVLRQVAARIRGSEHQELIRDLRWNEKNIAKALARWSAVFAVGSSADAPQPDAPMTGPLEDSDGDEELIEDNGDPDPGHSLRSSLAHDGIRFEIPPGRKLSAEVKEGLKKAHCNLGHPSKKDLQRFLRLGGAKQEVVEAVDWMRCLSCAHSSRPKTHRATNIPPCSVTFGDEVHLDCICVHDSGGESHWFLSIIDRATSYHA